ncbi:uncharacterized protein LOC132719862 [Ruditapes philippinarum]|uniref:uncharacterized protein LOC132719862 n=1 Tax=Ruditapes philippinarum TaxID=129788 RepID=UPI00295A8D7A|nr:uncharacterized protein LOC132719862 [Ruditapes philippinarum]
MSGTKNDTVTGDDKTETQTDSPDATEHLRVKLANINNELQDTMKICENYKEDKKIAEKAKYELEESRKKVTDLERRLADSESTCKRYRNERNNLRRDVARLIDERKQMISYEQDVQKLQRDIEMLKNKYDCDIREWKNKLSDTEKRYDEIIKEQKLKVQTAEQEVQKLEKELDSNSCDQRKDNQTETVSGELRTENKDLSNVPELTGDLIPSGSINVKSEMSKLDNTAINESNSTFDELTGKIDADGLEGHHSFNNDKGNNAHYADDHENYDDYDGEDTRNFKMKRHKIIKEYHTIESGEPFDEHDVKAKHTGDDRAGESDADLEDAKKISRPTGKTEDDVESARNVCETELPFNLADRYQQLYNNQWHNIYERIKHDFDSDIETVAALLEILLDTMDFCKRNANDQVKDIFKILTFSSEHKDEDISENVTKHLKYCMREVSSKAETHLFELYPASFRKKPRRPVDYDAKIEPFIKECFEFCWLLTIQDDPLEFRPLTQDEDELDLDIYNPYNNSGQYIKYVVWPALQYTSNGSIFAKGVAEADDKCVRRQPESLRFNKKIDGEQHVNTGYEPTDRDSSYQMSGKNTSGSYGGDKVERFEQYTNYNIPLRNQPSERSLHNTNDSYLRERNEFLSDRQEHPRRTDNRRLSDTSVLYEIDDDVLQQELNHEKRSLSSETKKADSSNRVRFGVKDKLTYQAGKSDLIHDRKYDLDDEERDNLSHKEIIRSENPYIQEQLDINDRHYYISKDRMKTQPLHAFNITEETKTAYPMAVVKTKATTRRGTTNVWTPSCGYERDPTPEEMRLYYRYIDHHDHTGARDVLGNAAYLRCLRKDHTQNFYG